jgi:V8-like Glu-specific endopeptidase
MFTCTAWVISPGYVITANHCVHAREESLPQAIELVLGYLSENQTDSERFDVLSTSIEVSRDLGYAILKVDGIPANEYDPIRLSSAPPKVGDPLFIAHHASGKSKSFSVNPCKVVEVSNSEITHNCDTSPGVSGAPLIRTSDLTIIGLHHRGIPTSHGKRNVAKRIDLIASKSKILSNLGIGQ